MQTLTLTRIPVVEEAQFLDRVRSGDVAAIAEVYDLHHATLCSFAARLLNDRHAAEDLVHDVFVALPSLVHKLEPDASLRGFLLGIAANRARHFVRAATRRRNAADRLAREPLTATESPEQYAERRSLARLLSRIMDGLPLDQRTTFVLSEIEGYDNREVARILGIPEATART
jgi:RNA polymerase sigma-70 factor, ECF subfamily